MSKTSHKGRKVKHRLTGRVGIIVGLAHYSRAEREGEFMVKWKGDNGALYVGNAHRCEVEFLKEEQ